MKAVLTLSAAFVMWAVLTAIGLNPVQPLADAQMEHSRQQTLQIRIMEQERTERAFIHSQERLERAAMRQETLLVLLAAMVAVVCIGGVLAVIALVVYSDRERTALPTVQLYYVPLPAGFQPVLVDEGELVAVHQPALPGGER